MSGATQQVRPDELANILKPEFQSRNEPNFAWKSACALYQSLPALRGFWPMSSTFYTVANRAADLSGQGNHLDDNNTPLFGYDRLAPYVEFDGTNQFLDRADGGAANWADIRGNEAYIVAAQRGLTLGGWFYFDDAAGSTEYLMAKWNTTAQRAYRILRTNAGTARFSVSTNGAAVLDVTTTALTVQSQWNFVAGRFDPSTEIKVWLGTGGTLSTATVVAAVPATIFDSTASFNVGSDSDPGNYLDGRASMCHLNAAMLSDTKVAQIWEQTRRMFEAS